MTIDPSTLAPDTPVMVRSSGGRHTVLSARLATANGAPPTVRVGEWLPTDEQEVPRDKWATITPGSRVRLALDGDLTVTGPVQQINDQWAYLGTEKVATRAAFVLLNVARVWVLDEPDPDADPTPIYTETACLHGFAPMPRELGTVNTPTLVRVAPPPTDATPVTYTGHGINHRTYPKDVTR